MRNWHSNAKKCVPLVNLSQSFPCNSGFMKGVLRFYSIHSSYNCRLKQIQWQCTIHTTRSRSWNLNEPDIFKRSFRNFLPAPSQFQVPPNQSVSSLLLKKIPVSLPDTLLNQILQATKFSIQRVLRKFAQ